MSNSDKHKVGNLTFSWYECSDLKYRGQITFEDEDGRTVAERNLDFGLVSHLLDLARKAEAIEEIKGEKNEQN